MSGKGKYRSEEATRKRNALAKLREQQRIAKLNEAKDKLKQDTKEMVAKLNADTEKKLQDYKDKLETSLRNKIAKKKVSYKKKVSAFEERKKKIVKVKETFSPAELLNAAMAKYEKKKANARLEILKTASELGFHLPIKQEITEGDGDSENETQSETGFIDLTGDLD